MARREQAGWHARARFGSRQLGGKQGYAGKSSARSDSSWGDLDPAVFDILILRLHSKFVCTNNMLLLGVYFLQPARALVAGLPRPDQVWITTDQCFHFHKDKFYEMLCNLKLDSTEYTRSFEQNSTLP